MLDERLSTGVSCLFVSVVGLFSSSTLSFSSGVKRLGFSTWLVCDVFTSSWISTSIERFNSSSS